MSKSPLKQTITIDASASGQRLDAFLATLFAGQSGHALGQMILKGAVRVNRKGVRPGYRLKLHDLVEAPLPRADREAAQAELEGPLRALVQAVLFEDSRFIIINKPSGMAVHGGSGLSYGVIEGLRALRPQAPYLELAHRLDRDTSGCLVIAKRKSALRLFQQQQQKGLVFKHYLTLVKGQWQGGTRKVVAPLLKKELKGERQVCVHEQGKYAASLFTPADRFDMATLMRVKLITGRTHQIRVHAQHCGHPIAGDGKYGDKAFNVQMTNFGLGRLFLHAESIQFKLPDLAAYDIHAPLNPELDAVCVKLTKV